MATQALSLVIILVITHSLSSVETVTVGLQSGALLTGDNVETSYGNVSEFLGIPYARPPVGSLRFMPPEPHPEDWDGELDVTEYREVCQQSPFDWDAWGVHPPPTYSEDCLFLNVHVPGSVIDNPGSKAVLVGIHGGGLYNGASNMFYGSNLAAEGDVIVVTMNYRLTIYGFFTTGTDGIQGNMGFRDQNLALQWVQKNIANFGGDPSRVTLFGQSAGGWSVSAQILNPASAGLFQSAITMSGFISGDTLLVKEDLKGAASSFAAQLSCPVSDEVQMIACLQALPVAALDGASFAILGILTRIVDGEGGVIRNQPRELFEAGAFNHVDTIGGVMKEDGQINLMIQTDFDDLAENGMSESLVRSLLQAISQSPAISDPEIIDLALDLYFPDLNDVWANLRGMIDFYTDFTFIVPTLIGLDAISMVKPTYLYQFREPLPNGMRIPQIDFGPPHSDEIPFLFGTLANASDEALMVSRSMMTAWSTFAKTGTPQFLDAQGQAVSWPRYYPNNTVYLDFKANMSSDISIRSRLRSAGVSFWYKIVPSITNTTALEPAAKDNNNNNCDVALYTMVGLVVVLFLVICIMVVIWKPWVAKAKDANGI